MFPKFVKILVAGFGCSVLCLVANAQELRVAQLVSAGTSVFHRNYPNALPSLLAAARETAGLPFAPEPLLLTSFTDPRLRDTPFLYINWDDRNDWESLDETECSALRQYLEGGGMAMIDAGIAASFLRTVTASQFRRMGPTSRCPGLLCQDFSRRTIHAVAEGRSALSKLL